MEADANITHGKIALVEGTEESARRAVAYFEKYLVVKEAIGNDEGIATAKASIDIVKSKYDDGNNNEELMKASQELYELCIAEYGEDEDDQFTIIAGKIYAMNLQDANRGEEARELLTRLLVTSKHVIGPHHNTTKDVESKI
jgi:hypothetical protein